MDGEDVQHLFQVSSQVEAYSTKIKMARWHDFSGNFALNDTRMRRHVIAFGNEMQWGRGRDVAFVFGLFDFGRQRTSTNKQLEN